MRCRSCYPLFSILGVLGCGLVGCLSPRLMSPEPIERLHCVAGEPVGMMPFGETNSDSLTSGGNTPTSATSTAIYDSDGDGRGDYGEQIGPDGRVAVLHFDTDHDGELDLQVDLDRIDNSQCRELLIILDSVPFGLVRKFRDAGRFRLFHPPSAIVSPFPVMTDLCLAEFFGVSPCQGIESRYYDGHRLSNGYLTYFAEGNAPWLKMIDAYIWPINHSYIYLAPEPGFLHELHAIEQRLFRNDRDTVLGYSVGASAMGSRLGEAGHQQLLEYVDRFCQSIMQRTRGRLRITLMSDHGHNLIECTPISVHKELTALGYRESGALRRPADIVVPRFGPVTCAGVYTNQPQNVAADLVKIDGVDLAFYRDGDEIVVHSSDGRALIERSRDRYRYVAEQLDPLQLLPVIEHLREESKLDAAGFVSDADWFQATADHVYPDPLHRLWRAFDGLLRNPPDVMVSLQDGHCYGTSFFNKFVQLKSAHGSLLRSSTHGFAMSTAGRLPEFVRMEDLARELENLGLQPISR